MAGVWWRTGLMGLVAMGLVACIEERAAVVDDAGVDGVTDGGQADGRGLDGSAFDGSTLDGGRRDGAPPRVDSAVEPDAATPPIDAAFDGPLFDPDPDRGLADMTPDHGPAEPDTATPPPCPATRGGACDDDRDEVGDDDNCPDHWNPSQRDVDGDGRGDACDDDDDGDGVVDAFDPCPWQAGGRASACADDVDGDGIVNADDACPGRDDTAAPCARTLAPLTWTGTVSTFGGEWGWLTGTHGGLVGARGRSPATMTDGLASNRVVDFAAGPRDDGPVWVATDEGLSVLRGDGLGFTVAHAGVRVDDVAQVEGRAYSLVDGDVWSHGPAGDTPLDVRATGLVDTAHEAWWFDAHRLERLGPAPLSLGEALGSIAPFTGVYEIGLSDAFWIYGANGVARVDPHGLDAPWQITVTGVEVLDVTAHHDSGLYLLTPDGIRHLDGGFVLRPPSRPLDIGPPVPAIEEIRSIAPASDGLLAATAGGVHRFGALPATWTADALGTACVTHVVRDGSRVWIGTDQGLYLTRPAGLTRIDEIGDAPIVTMTPVDDEIWVATPDAVYIFDHPRGMQAVYRRGAELPDAPITAMAVEPISFDLWVGTHGGGLAHRDFGGNWSYYRAGDGPGALLDDVITALAFRLGHVWIGHPGRLAHLELDSGAVTLEREVSVNAMRATFKDIYIATAEGVLVRQWDGTWHTLDRANGGLPPDAASDDVRDLEVGERLWLLIADEAPGALGQLVERPMAPAQRDAMVTLGLDALGLEPVGADGVVTLGPGGRNPTLAVCGEVEAPGSATIFVGDALDRGDDETRGMLDGGADTRLTGGPDRGPLVGGETPRGAFAFLPSGADFERLPLPDDATSPVECSIPRVAGDDLWCVFRMMGFGRMFENGHWAVGRPDVLPALVPDVRAIAVERDTVAWVATARGVVHVNGGAVRGHTVASTAAALPDDDVRDVALGDGVLYAGTAAGVAAYPSAAQRWAPFAAGTLPDPSVRALAIDARGRVWIATDRGLSVRRADGEVVADYDPSDGLPTARIDDVAIDGDERVWAATARGLALRGPDGRFRVWGPTHGLPGRRARALHVDGDGILWVQSDDGVARVIDGAL